MLSHFSAMESSKWTHLSVAGTQQTLRSHLFTFETNFQKLNKQTDFKWRLLPSRWFNCFPLIFHIFFSFLLIFRHFKGFFFASFILIWPNCSIVDALNLWNRYYVNITEFIAKNQAIWITNKSKISLEFELLRKKMWNEKIKIQKIMTL